MRPLGGVIMGVIGDTLGRQRALEVSIGLMLLPSFLIGCLPVYSAIGIGASIMLVFLRLLQVSVPPLVFLCRFLLNY